MPRYGQHKSSHKEAVEKYVVDLMPKKIKKLTNYALEDLYSGPLEDGPGFSKAVQEVGDWVHNEMPSQLWYDIQSGEVLEKEPKGFEDEDGEWVEPVWDDYYEFDRAAIKKAVFGELAGYV